MPLAIAVGRRTVLLTATAIMVVGAILCAHASNLEWHLGARMLIGLAAGQSEALVPMINQVRCGQPRLLRSYKALKLIR